MIVDLVKNLSLYSKSFPILGEIEKFILENPLEKLPLGTTQIKSDDLFINVMNYATHTPAMKLESHRLYADVHMIDGEEQIRYLVHAIHDADVEYDGKNDVEFFKSPDTSSLILTKRHFALFLPKEAHEPGCMFSKSQNVRKYVFKIKM